MRFVVVAVLAAACGGPKDDCERIYEKLSASIPEFHKDETKWLRKCRAETEPPSTDPELACTLAADSAAAVRRCMRDTYGRDHDGDDALQRYGKQQEALAKEKAEAKAKVEAEEAARSAAAMRRIDELEKQLGDLGTRLDAAVSGTLAAQNAAERAAAQVKLAELRAERADMERRIAEAKAAAARAERLRGITVSKDCLDNPLAKGCP